MAKNLYLHTSGGVHLLPISSTALVQHATSAARLNSQGRVEIILIEDDRMSPTPHFHSSETKIIEAACLVLWTFPTTWSPV